LFRYAAELVAILNASLQHDALKEISNIKGCYVTIGVPAMIAFVEAMAGIMFLTTP
jgi:hypothetical protein